MSNRTAHWPARLSPIQRFPGPGMPARAYPTWHPIADFFAGGWAPWPGWWGIALLGAGLIAVGALAVVVAATRVVLPYDEAFVGLSRGELAGAQVRLLPFMAHDRVALAGTLVAIGVLYTQLAVWGMRRGLRSARTAALVSGAAGFASFLLCLGFGYFDPLHALATGGLLPLFLLGWWGRVPAATPPAGETSRYDRRWRLGRSARGLFLLIGGSLTLAGVVIAAVGTTTVFVPEDLAF